MSRYINPFTDWGFKRIFGQEFTKDLLISFLNDLFEGMHHITDITFLDKEQLPEAKDMRGVIYDIYCKTADDTHIIVEMQNRYQEYFLDRTIFYAARSIVGQSQRGLWDYSLVPVYTICFMNYGENEDTPHKFRTDVMLADIDTGKPFSEKLRFIYLMLPLFKKEEDECENNFERWIYVLRNMNTFERMPFLAKNAVFKKLAEIADVSSLTQEDQNKYDESLKIMRDAYATYKTAVKQGKEEGRAEGRAEGMKQGRAEGMKQGRAEGMKEGMKEGERLAKLDMARGFISAGTPLEVVIQVTGLTMSDIEGLA